MARRYFRFKKAQEIVSTLIDNTITRTDQINDFTDGSILKTLYEAFALELESYYYLNTENIKDGVWNSIYKAFDFGRLPACRAYGYVQLTFNSPLTRNMTISRNLTVSSTDPNYPQTYETMDEYTIPAGTRTINILVYCTQSGTYGNIPSGVLDKINSVSNLSSITNINSFNTGQEEESMTAVRVRFRNFIQSLQRGTVQAIQYGAKTIPNVQGVYLEESTGIVRLYAHDANGDLPDALQQDIQNQMPYYRSAGIPVVVLPIHKTTIDANIFVDVKDNNLRTDDFLDYIKLTATKYLDNFKVHNDLVKSDMIQKVMDVNDLGILDTRVDLMASPDSYLRNTMAVNPDTSIYLNGRMLSRANLAVKDRSLSEDYIVSNPEDYDRDQLAPIVDDDTRPDLTSTSTVNPKPDGNVELTTTDFPEPVSSTTVRQIKASLATVRAMNLQFFAANTETTTTTTSTTTPKPTSTTTTTEVPSTTTTTTESTSTTTTTTEPVAPGDNIAFSYTNPQGDFITLYFDKDHNLYEAKIVKKDKSQLILDRNLNTTLLLATYIAPDGKKSYGNIQLGSTENLVNNRINYGTDLISIKESDGTLTYIFLRTASMKQEYMDGSNVVVKIDLDKKQKTIIYDDGKGVTTSTTTTFDNKMISSQIIYENQNGTYTTINKDKDGKVISTVITDKNGNVISSTTTTTTVAPTSTTTTTVAPTTTTTTTAYPFKNEADVSAEDAPDSGYLPVYGRYITRASEILKAGKIQVFFMDRNS